MVFYVLFESASGYGLFERKQVEEIGSNTIQVQDSYTDFEKFNKMVSLKGFAPFTSPDNALANVNSISEGILPDLLKTFLLLNIPHSKAKTELGVSDADLGSAIQDAFPHIQCQKTQVVAELSRGIRLFFTKFIKELKGGALEKAQLSLGHSYSRAKVKFNVHRVDNMIIQSISLLDQLDKDLNTFAMRCREWYSWHFPELIKIVPDNYQFARLAKLITNKSELTEEHIPTIAAVLNGDEHKAKQVVDAAKASMGTDISEIDMVNIEAFATRVISLAEYRTNLHAYLSKKMTDVAPNLSTLMGDQVGARLIARAGSLTNLAKFPASTVQILGAEKALFRALKTKGNTPKYGLIYHSTFIGRASQKNKGRISRYLANKAVIASRIDSFSDNPSTVFGEKLREQVEERLRFYDSGQIPKKNIEVMREAIAINATNESENAEKTPKKSKKRTNEESSEAVSSEKKSKKQKKKEKKEKQGKEVAQENVSKQDQEVEDEEEVVVEKVEPEPQTEETPKKSKKEKKKEKKEKKKGKMSV